MILSRVTNLRARGLMRWMLLLFPVFVPFMLLVLEPQPFRSLASGVSNATEQVARSRELRIEGVDGSLALSVRKSLPHERSNLWWRTHLSSLEIATLGVAGLKSASVRPCRVWSLSCYEISVEKLAPSLLVEIAGVQWTASADGALITPTSESKNREILPLVRGEHFDSLTPQDLQQTLRSVSHALKVIRGKTALEIVDVDVQGDGDLVLSAVKVPFEILVSLNSSPEVPPLDIQSERLAKLLSSEKIEHDQVSRVDVSYRNLAVISHRL